MTLGLVRINDFRNLDAQSLELDKHLTLVFGQNGSGKTSILEAIYTLTSGRSFKTQKLESLILKKSSGDQGSSFTLYGELEDKTRVGLRKSKSEKALIKINGEKCSTSSALASLCPTLVVEPGNLDLLSGSPSSRRKFMDWGVFHVEHGFARLWKNYIDCVKQRNALLKRTAQTESAELDIWDRRLVELGEKVHALRMNYFETFSRSLALMSVSKAKDAASNPIDENASSVGEFALRLDFDIDVRYTRGWDKKLSLSEALDKNRNIDIERGYTSVGPHRMDVRIRSGSQMACEVLSRGQQKLLILSLYVSQVRALRSLTGKSTLVLIDDLPSELDERNIERTLVEMLELKTQLICTCIEPSRLVSIAQQRSSFNMFHVEHGKVKRTE